MLTIKRLTTTAKLPERAYPDDAGLDLCADERLMLAPGARGLVGTGIAVAIAPGKVGLIWPRSGLAISAGLDTGAGVIDSGYRGEVKVLLFNHGTNPAWIEPGDKIAQLLIQHVHPEIVEEVDELPPSYRDQRGFGSSGK
jgi:dUTP pyrophosphatase